MSSQLNYQGILAFFVAFVCSMASVSAGQTQWDAGDPTPDEQYVLEMINRARADPIAEGTRLKIDIHEGLSATDAALVKVQPPLAMNKILLTISRFHSQDMYTNNYFAHNDLSGKSPFDRMTAAGYNWNNAGENIATATSETSAQLEDDLMIDSQIPGRGHRINLLDIFSGPPRMEVGIGYYKGATPNASHFGTFETQDFGSNGTGPFIVGVVYNDKNGNNFYDQGEELAGVTVTPSTGNYFAITSTSGGYAFPTVNGSVTLTFSGGALAGPITKTVTVSGANVKVDARASEASGGGTGGGNGGGTGGGTGGSSGGLGGGTGITGTDANGKTIPSKTLIDTDQDGFPDELETALGTDPVSAASTPIGGSPAGMAQTIPNPKLAISLNFAKTNADSVALSGGLSIPSGFTVLGQKVTVDVGGVIQSFSLDVHGNAGTGTPNTFKLRAKAIKGVVAAQTAPFTAKFIKGAFASFLTDEGLTNATVTNAALTVPVIVFFNNTLYYVAQPQLYSAKQSKTGRSH